MFRKILIANRGEIAIRVARACKELGIKSATIFSEADINSLHTQFSDESYFIGKAEAADSYLKKEKIINLALKIGADAIHPGYGFLSENADFIEMVENSGIKFIGPKSQSVRMMGSKTSARELMKKNGVPIVPGTTQPIKNIDDGFSFCKEIGFPVLLKASAGGGGKGMKVVNDEKEFLLSFQSAQREALKAFANDEVYIEKLIINPKHIEVQIIADEFGNYRHLFERECSIQRRHQKIIEESPSAALNQKLREKVTQIALNAAKSCFYTNAGTVELLKDEQDNFYFLEMNTRLQVEHPVTELVTGIDLVKEQISIAAGNKISFEQSEISQNGFAIECRIYAEDSQNGFLPSTGKILFYKEPAGIGVRVDSGVTTNSEITINYDPMIAKLICWSKKRDETINRTLRALDEFFVAGIETNIQFLKFVLNSEQFRTAKHNINSIEKELLEKFLNFNQQVNYEDELEVVSVLSSFLRQQSTLIIKKGNNSSKNHWYKQNYE
jgi:acetyl-CoA carboxylase biotin carboxylase subunit